MNPNQKLWNQQLQTLRRALSRPEDHPEAIELFLSQHAMVHSAKMARSNKAPCYCATPQCRWQRSMEWK